MKNFKNLKYILKALLTGDIYKNGHRIFFTCHYSIINPINR